MSPRTFYISLAQLGLAGLVLLLSHYGYGWIAVPVVVAPTVYAWFRNQRSTAAMLAASPDAVVGLSVVVLVGLSRQPLGQPVFPVLTQIAITCAYAVWLIRLRQLRLHKQASEVVLGVQVVAAVTAIFLAVAFWHWPEALAIAAIWASMTVTALWYLTTIGERSAAILATAWGLVASEIAWVMYLWQVNYILKGDYLIVPQITLVILGVGYCFASIYHSHKEKRLSRRRLIEYVAITAVLFAILIAGTRWNGTV